MAIQQRVSDRLDLLDWKRRIFELYAQVRAAEEPEAAWQLWRDVRDELFRTHPQSPLPLEARSTFLGLAYFDYDPGLRILGELEPAPDEPRPIAATGGAAVLFQRFARAHFELGSQMLALELYWLEGYGGGVYLPFRDETSGAETYGGGRYLLDSVKGSDLGASRAQLILDFNFAYNPSCSYDPSWVCPLAPPPNQLSIPIRAGERQRS